MADKIVEVPGVGNVSFPDTMSDDEIALHVRKSLASQNKPADSDKGWFGNTVDAISTYFGRANATGNPVSSENLKANEQLVRHPIDTGKAILGSQGALATAAKDSFSKGDYLEGVRHAVAYMIPVLGPAIDQAGNKAQHGDVAGGLGDATGIALPIAAGMRPGAPPAAPGGVSPTAVKIYQKALGLRRNMPRADARAMAETGVKEGLPITEQGAQKLNTAVGDLSTNTADAIDQGARAGMTVSRDRAVAEAGPTIERFNTVTPSESRKGGLRVIKDFVNDHPDEQIPVDVAQKRKIATYQEVELEKGQKGFGEVGNSEIEMKKAIAHSFMSQIEQLIPEVGANNARQGALLDLKPAFETALDKAANGTGTTVKDLLIAEVAAHGSGVPGAGLAAGVLARVMRDPGFRSKLAIAINEAQKTNPGKFGPPSMARATAKAAFYTDKVLANAASAADSSAPNP